MVTIPTREDFGQRPVGRPQRGVARVSNPEALGRAVEQVGQTVSQIGDEIADREFTAMSKERDAYVSDQIRELIYNPETGFANKLGRNAVADRNAGAVIAGPTAGLIGDFRNLLQDTLRGLSDGEPGVLSDFDDGTAGSIDRVLPFGNHPGIKQFLNLWAVPALKGEG